MRGPASQPLADAHALAVALTGVTADCGLRSFVVDVPLLEMLERSGIHDDERRMDDRPSIHQRTRQRVAAGLDRAGKSLADDLKRMVSKSQRKDAGRQMLAAGGNLHLMRAVLARQPRQGTSFRECKPGVVAGLPNLLGKEERTERSWRQEHDLPLGKVRREQLGNVGLRE